MPKVPFTDTTIARMEFHDKPTFYTDAHPTRGHCRYPGLRLCIGKASKTFYVVSGKDGRSVSERLGAFGPEFGVAQAWNAAQVAKGRGVRAKGDFVIQDETPTLMEATREYCDYMQGLNPKVARPMTKATAQKYLRAVEQHLGRWMAVKIDALPTLEIRRHLDTLQQRIPYGAAYAHVAISATMRWQAKHRDLALKIPGLTTMTGRARVQVDRNVSWADRWSEIEQVQNPFIRAAWKVRWLTGLRVESFIGRKWSDLSFDMGTLSVPHDKRHPARIVALADPVLQVLDELPRVSDHIFASSKAPHLYHRLDRLKSSTAQELRHLWHDAVEGAGVRRIVAKWLAGQVERDIRGHYTQPPLEVQKEAANMIAAYILERVSTPAELVELPQFRVARGESDN